MKTSILVSSFAALCLLITFAEAPRRHRGDKMNVALTNNIEIPTMNRVTMLPGVIISAGRIKEAAYTVPVIPAEDFSYMKFEVNEFIESDVVNIDAASVLPESIEAGFSYLKFEIGDFMKDSEFTGDEMTELPESENNATEISAIGPVVNDLEYLRFDVNVYMNNSITEISEIGELPMEAPIIEFGYLKFDVNKYCNPEYLSSAEPFELPEE